MMNHMFILNNILIKYINLLKMHFKKMERFILYIYN